MVTLPAEHVLIDFELSLPMRTYHALKRYGVQHCDGVEVVLRERPRIKGIGAYGWRELQQAYDAYQARLIAEVRRHAY